MEKDVRIKISYAEENAASVNKAIERLKKISTIQNSIGKGVSGQNTGLKVLEDVNTEKIGKVNTSLNKLFDVAKYTAFYYSISRIVSKLTELTKLSADYVENLNLTEVAYYGDAEAVDELVSKMSEAYNFDESRLTKSLGIFKQLANAMELPIETGEKLSSLMVKMTNDISSLYNIDLTRAENALQSALVGQVRPIRGATGADITENTLQKTMEDIGLDGYIRNMSFAEKRLLMVISLTNQLKNSQGDFARTIESTSNQMRIMGDQFSRLGRAIGNVFMPILQAILPYINAILMVLTEIFNLIASLLGFEMPEFDYSGLSGMSDATNDLIDGMDEASASADTLANKMKGLRAFDKLNVISTPSTSDSDSGISSGIDTKIMDAFNKAYEEYNDMMDGIQTKASKIRDVILDWLGFTDGTYKNLKLIGIVLGAMAGLKIFTIISGLVTGSSKLGKVFKTGGLLDGVKTIFTYLTTLGVGGSLEYLWLILKDGFTKIKTFLPTLGKASTFIGGIAGLFVGSKGIINSVKNLTTQSGKATKSVGKLAIGFGEATAGGALLGSVIPGVGTVIGALTGAIVGGISAIVGYENGLTSLAKSKVFGDLSVSSEQWKNILETSVGSVKSYSDAHNNLKTTLENLNTKFKTNSDALEIYGIKFGKLSQKMSTEDAQNVKSALNEMVTSTSTMIEENTNYSLGIWGDMFTKMDTITETEEKDILQSIYNYGQSQQKELKKAQDNITTTYDKAIKTRGYLTDEEYKYIQTQLTKIREMTQKEMSLTESELIYQKTQYNNNSSKLDEKSYKDLSTTLKTYKKEQLDIIKENYRLALENAQSYYNNGALSLEQYNKEIKTLNAKRLTDESNLRTGLDSVQKSIYQDLADTYQEIYNKTDSVSRKIRTLIEGVFKDIDVNKSDIISQFSTLGEVAGNTYATSIGKGFNSGNLKLSLPSNNKLGIDSSDYSMAFKAAYTTVYSKRKNGGLPSVGELFVANESGPEIIANLGGRSVVANENQVLASVRAEISNKNSQPLNIVVNVGDETLAKKVIRDINSMATTNGKPITIGG